LSQNAEAGGYLSPEHKKTFTMTVGILQALLFLAAARTVVIDVRKVLD